MSFSHSVHGGCIPACDWIGGVSPEGVCPGEGVCLGVSARDCLPGGCLPRGCLPEGVCAGRCLPEPPGNPPPPEAATEAGGMHPTGMHSCYI